MATELFFRETFQFVKIAYFLAFATPTYGGQKHPGYQSTYLKIISNDFLHLNAVAFKHPPYMAFSNFHVSRILVKCFTRNHGFSGYTPAPTSVDNFVDNFVDNSRVSHLILILLSDMLRICG